MSTELGDITAVLNKASANLDSCAGGIGRAVEAISHSCDLCDTQGPLRRIQLEPRISALKNLQTMCEKGAERLSNLLGRLQRGASREEAMKELLNFSNDSIGGKQAGGSTGGEGEGCL